MDIVAVSMVKNEADIIEAFVRHTLTHARHLIVHDDGSSDGTNEILQSLADEGLPLRIMREQFFGKPQSRIMTRLMGEYAVERYRAEWVMPLDADEFVANNNGNLPIDEDMGADNPIAVPWRSYVPHDEDDISQVNPAMRMQYRLEEGCQGINVLVPRSLACLPGAELLQGNHQFAINGQPLTPAPARSAYLAHFPVRSPGQYLAKIAISTLQYRCEPARGANLGLHYRKPFELLKDNPHSFTESYAQAARSYLRLPCERINPTLVHAPFPYRGGPLRYTKPVDDSIRGWRAVLKFAEELAMKYGVLSASVTDDARSVLANTTSLVGKMWDHVNGRHNEIAELQRQLVEKENVIQQLKARIDITPLQQQLVEKENVIQQLKARVDSPHDLMLLQRQLVEKGNVIQQLKEHVLQQEKSLQQNAIGPVSRMLRWFGSAWNSIVPQKNNRFISRRR
jgi:hypothetical protein